MVDRRSAAELSSADAQDVCPEHCEKPAWPAPVPLDPPRKKVQENTSSQRAMNNGCLAVSLDQGGQLGTQNLRHYTNKRPLNWDYMRAWLSVIWSHGEAARAGLRKGKNAARRGEAKITKQNSRRGPEPQTTPVNLSPSCGRRAERPGVLQKGQLKTHQDASYQRFQQKRCVPTLLPAVSDCLPNLQSHVDERCGDLSGRPVIVELPNQKLQHAFLMSAWHCVLNRIEIMKYFLQRVDIRASQERRLLVRQIRQHAFGLVTSCLIGR